MSNYSYAGLIMILVGLFEMFITPLLLKRLWTKHPPPHPDSVIRMIRFSGLFVVVLGLVFLSGIIEQLK